MNGTLQRMEIEAENVVLFRSLLSKRFDAGGTQVRIKFSFIAVETRCQANERSGYESA